MRELKFSLLVCMLLCVSNAWAQSVDFSVGGINYSIIAPDEVQVRDGSYSGDITVPGQVTYNNTTYRVTGILQAFAYNANLTSLTLSEGIVSIESNSIENCSKLTTVTIPSTVSYIEEGTFNSCPELLTINVSPSNSNYVFEDGVLYTADKKTLLCYPAGKIEQNWWEDVIIPEGVERIGAYAFSNTVLPAIELPTTLKTIGLSAFYMCQNLESIDIPEGVTTIENSAFVLCSRLTTANIPASVVDIGQGVFGNTKKLSSINVASGNTAYKSIDGVLFSADGKTLVDYPGGKADVSYSIPNGVTRIENGAIDYCSNLKNIEIPGTVTHIGDVAFSDIDEITSLTIPASVKNIGIWLLFNCNKMQSLYVEWDNPNEVTLNSGNTLSSIANEPGIVLYVPTGTKSLYQAADDWKYFPDIREYDPQSTSLPSLSDMGVTIRIAGSSIVVEGAEVYPVAVYGISGQCVAQGAGAGTYAVPAAGVYIVRVGSEARKVIVP
jgi:hypothetical protein